MVISIPFLIFAVILSKGKGAGLLSGYNNLSDSEKAQYNEVALYKFMGKLMYGFSILLIALSERFKNHILFSIGVVLLVILIIYGVVYTNTRDRFKKKCNIK